MTQQRSAGVTFRAIADLTDELDALDDMLGTPRLNPAAYAYAANGLGVHVTQYDRDGWHDRAATIMGTLGGRWEPRSLDLDVALTSTVADRTTHPDVGTIRVYVPRWDRANAAWPSTDLKGLPGLVTP